MRKFIVLLTVMAMVSAASGGVLVHYEFEGDVLDSSSNGNDGTVDAGAPTFVPGMFGQAAEFNGDDRIALPSFTNFHNRTVTFWTNFDDTNNTHVFVNQLGYFMNAQPYGGWWNFQFGPTNAGANFPAPATGEWHHYAMVLRDTSATTYDAEVYEDGVRVNTSTAGDGLPLPTGDLLQPMIGANASNLGFLQGRIDDFAIFDTPLSLSEIQGVMANGVPEPATMTLLGMGILAVMRRRRV